MIDEIGEAAEARASKKSPDILEMLVEALCERIKAKLMEEIEQKIAKSVDSAVEDQMSDASVEADNVKGLEEFVSSGIDEYMRHGDGRKIDADDVDGLETLVENIINNGSFSFCFSS